jgi:hypothetical protein
MIGDHACRPYWHWAMVVRALGKLSKRLGADREKNKNFTTDEHR